MPSLYMRKEYHFVISQICTTYINIMLMYLHNTCLILVWCQCQCNTTYFYCLIFYFQDDFDSLRPLCYPNTDVFLLCFSVVTPTSFHNVTEKWVPEVRKHCPKAPIVLVGTQSDLRNDVKVLIELAHYKEEPIPENEGKLLAERIGAVDYVECSALTQKNLKEVFDTAIIAALSGPIKRNRSVRRSKKEKKLTSPPVTSTEKNIKKNSWKRFCCFL